MNRRDLLTAAELTLATAALAAAVYGLVAAASNPRAAVQWAPVVAAGAVVAAALVGLAAVLFVGRAALLLSADAVRAWRWRREAPPSTARHRNAAAVVRPRRRTPSVWQGLTGP